MKLDAEGDDALLCFDPPAGSYATVLNVCATLDTLKLTGLRRPALVASQRDAELKRAQPLGSSRANRLATRRPALSL